MMNSNINSRNCYYIFPLDCPSSEQEESCPSTSSPLPTLSEVGGKALSLYDASSTFPVPPGLVLTVAFFESWLEKIQQMEAWKNYADHQSPATAMADCDAIKEQCEKILSLDDDQTILLEEAIKVTFGSEANITNNLSLS